MSMGRRVAFATCRLPDYGVETVYYDPLIGDGVAALLDGACGLLFESPGSHTFEMPDIPKMVAAARAAGVTTMIDNTWATPLIYRPLEHGIDMAIYAGTKYQGGHSDLMIGSITANEAAWPGLKKLHGHLGLQAGTEEIWLTLRGLRTMGVRLERHEKSALQIAKWLKARREVKRVLHPALPDDPSHAIWKRDFGRSSGSLQLRARRRGAPSKAFLNALAAFRARLFVGWLREPRHSERARSVPHGAQMDRGSGHPPTYWAGGCRRPHRTIWNAPSPRWRAV